MNSECWTNNKGGRLTGSNLGSATHDKQLRFRLIRRFKTTGQDESEDTAGHIPGHFSGPLPTTKVETIFKCGSISH